MVILPTRWKGFSFRSRTEARWAVFFAALGVRFEYERERYELPSGSYLPDFYIRVARGGLWAEVKGKAFLPLESQLCLELAYSTTTPCLLLDGAPDYGRYALVMPSGATQWLHLIREENGRHVTAVEAARGARFDGGRRKK